MSVGDIKFTPDLSRATIGVSDLQQQLADAQAAAQKQAAAIAQAARVQGAKWPTYLAYGLGILIGLAVLAFIVDFIFVKTTGKELTGFGWITAFMPPEPTPAPPVAPPTPAPTGTTPTPTPAPSTQALAPPTPFAKLYSAIFGGSTPNLAPVLHDATNTVIVPGKNAPLSSGPEGGYSMQWWMFIKDWNYGYGKPKSVIRRPDATTNAIANPDISLHPTDNTLQVSVSIYPSTEGGAAKAQPAPAGHSGSTDDVFVCEVPNIPLQTWFSVSLSVFGRNLDIYIDGKLVKSCFLTGVPKPAVGDIQLTPGGGFSGSVCNFYHYSRMLTPADAIAFWSAGTPCQNQTLPDGNMANKYSVNFGMYDATGKKIQNYTF